MPEILAIPVHHHFLACLNTCSKSHMQFDGRIIADHNPSRSLCGVNTETIALSGKVMAFTAYHLPRRLTWLLFETSLLSFDPTQLANHGQAHRLVADPEWCSHSHTPSGRIHPEVKILYVLPNDLDTKA